MSTSLPTRWDSLAWVWAGLLHAVKMLLFCWPGILKGKNRHKNALCFLLASKLASSKGNANINMASSVKLSHLTTNLYNLTGQKIQFLFCSWENIRSTVSHTTKQFTNSEARNCTNSCITLIISVVIREYNQISKIDQWNDNYRKVTLILRLS